MSNFRKGQIVAVPAVDLESGSVIYEDLEILPFFVYGTLKPGHKLSGIIYHAVTESHGGTLEDFGMVDMGAFPAIYPCTGSVVKGVIVHFHLDLYHRMVRMLDGVEGEGVLYKRTVVEAKRNHGDVERCYTYVKINYRSSREEAFRIPGGDWKLEYEVR